MPQPRTRIKICGVRDITTARVCADSGVDAVGLVFAEGSDRQLRPQDAAIIVRYLPAFVTPVALFVNSPVDEIKDICAQTGIGTVQLHGNESIAMAMKLAPLLVVKAVGFRGEPGPITGWAESMGSQFVDPPLVGLLIDAPPGATPGQAGGTGAAVDWKKLAAVLDGGLRDRLPPVILAGGLKPGNVAEAILTVKPYAVDVSSGVESSRGVKDAGMIRAFCEAVRRN